MSYRAACLLVPATLILAACSKPAASPPANAAAAAPASPVAITLAEYSIAAPATLPAGFTTFKANNIGKEMHQAALVRLDSGKTYTDFQNALKAKGPLPGWAVWVGGPQNTSEVGLDLVPGTYVWYCVIPAADGVPHVMKGMSSPMTVTAATAPSAAPPATDIDVTVRDYQWDMSTPVTAGHHVFKVTVAPGQPHEMIIVRLAPGKTAKDMLAWAMKPSTPPPAESLQGIATLRGGETNYLAADFTPGNYALMCFVPDAKDGKPHALHGMVKEFTVQ